MNVVTRFPPSPTGFLHVGSLRTALYNYLFARHHGGRFILRVEDTDRSRYVEGAVESLIRTMNVMGLDYDEGPTLVNDEILEVGENGPYVQSNRSEIYTKHVQQLIEQGDAYHCFCSKEHLAELRKTQQLAKLPTKYDRTCAGLSKDEIKTKMDAGEAFVIRLKIPEGPITFKDEIRGSVTIDGSEVDDQVLMKADGFPTYHLAVVIDDHLMGVTHVIRGEEWISSVPKHVLLYQKLGFPLPVFAHLPLILNPDKSKLSKRQGDVAVEDFLKKGYLPEALLNFVALLGFNPSGDQEIYTVKELQDSFDLSSVNKSGAVFDVEKLNWMNGQYIKELEPTDLIDRVRPYTPNVDTDLLGKILAVEKDRLSFLSEITEHLDMYTQTPEYDSDILVWKKADKEDAIKQLTGVGDLIKELTEEVFVSVELIEGAIKKYIGDNELQNGNVLWPMRVSLSGQGRSPSPFELAWILGKTETTSRISRAIDKLVA
mgnify:CR=1 FL=1|jgi:glutamyl-tRNA synthetase